MSFLNSCLNMRCYLIKPCKKKVNPCSTFHFFSVKDGINNLVSWKAPRKAHFYGISTEMTDKIFYREDKSKESFPIVKNGKHLMHREIIL